MQQANPAQSHNKVVRKISATLQGPVLDALGDLVPEVKRLPKRGALEAILDDVELLQRCLLAFRAHPQRFRDVLVNRHKVAVEHAEAILECGRSLDQVIAMVVRTAAKRHFRRRLDGAPGPARKRMRRRTAPKRDLLSRMLGLVGPETKPLPMPKSQGEQLYEAFKDYLMHDWQVAMIPEYCTLSPGIVRRLGPRILDYRLAEDIRRLKADPDNPPPPTPLVDGEQLLSAGYIMPTMFEGADELLMEDEGHGEPTPITGVAETRPAGEGIAPINYGPAERTSRDERARLEDVLTPDGKRLKADAFTIVLLDPKVRETLPHSEQTVRITNILGRVNGLAGKMLVGELGLRTDQLAVFLMAAYSALGEKRFEMAFGVPGRPEYVARIVERAKAFKIGQPSSLAGIVTFVSQSFKPEEAKG